MYASMAMDEPHPARSPPTSPVAINVTHAEGVIWVRQPATGLGMICSAELSSDRPYQYGSTLGMYAQATLTVLKLAPDSTSEATKGLTPVSDR